jgi:hypothetical protein
MSSSFADSLNAIVDRREAEQRDQKAAAREFVGDWLKVRKHTIAPIFRETVHLLRKRGQNAHFRKDGDKNAVLVVRRSELEFHAEIDEQRIVCSGPNLERSPARREDPPPKPQAFRPAELTRERVEQEVEDFVKAAVKQPPPSSS